MVLIFTIFMLLKREDLRNRLLRLAGIGQLNVMTQVLDDASGRVSRYLAMQFLVNAGFGTLFGSGLYFIGVPDPALWGVVAGMLRYVPYVGTLVAATMPLALSLAVFDGWLRPLLVFVLVAALELIIANFVEPWLYGTHVGISALALLVTAVFWAVLSGPAGLILSTPLTVCAVVLGRYFPHLSFLDTLLGDEPVLAADAQIYQRLLAMDQLEAQTVVGEYLKGRPLVELYDAVLLPALSMAELDRHKGALSAAREEFLFLSINEMVVEFSEYPLADTAATTDTVDRPNHRIVCLPAYDRADEIMSAMLAQILEQKGLTTLSFPLLGPSAAECLASIQPDPGDIAWHLGAAPLRVCAGARHVQADPRTLSEAQSDDLRLGIQGRCAESHGPFRANATRSPVHHPGGGNRARSGTRSSQTGGGSAGRVTLRHASSFLAGHCSLLDNPAVEQGRRDSSGAMGLRRFDNITARRVNRKGLLPANPMPPPAPAALVLAVRGPHRFRMQQLTPKVSNSGSSRLHRSP